MAKQRNEQIKVLSGKTFFFDLKGSPTTRVRALEIHLKSIGGTRQNLFTNSVHFLITNQRLDERCLRSSATARNQNKNSRREILEKAALWNVQIKHIDQVSNLIRSLSVKPTITPHKLAHRPTSHRPTSHRPTSPTKNRAPIVGRNVLKVEDNSRVYRPTIKNIPIWPMILPSSLRSGVVTRNAAKKEATVISTRRTAVTEAMLTKQSGYCESCNARFVNVITHLKSANHLKFASNRENYKNLDKQLQKGKTVDDFLEEMASLDSKASTSAATPSPRQRSAPASVSKTRTPKQTLLRKGSGASSSNSVPSQLLITPARGAGALSNPPADESPVPLPGSSHRATSKSHLKAVKRKLFFDDSDGDKDEPKNKKTKGNKETGSDETGRRSGGIVQDLQERLRHLSVIVQKVKIRTKRKARRASHKTKTRRNAVSIRRVVSKLKKGLKYSSPVLTSMEMRNGKMKICNAM